MVELTKRPATAKQRYWKAGVAKLALLAALTVTPMLASDAGGVLQPENGSGSPADLGQPGSATPQVNWSCRSNCA